MAEMHRLSHTSRDFSAFEWLPPSPFLLSDKHSLWQRGAGHILAFRRGWLFSESRRQPCRNCVRRDIERCVSILSVDKDDRVVCESERKGLQTISLAEPVTYNNSHSLPERSPPTTQLNPTQPPPLLPNNSLYDATGLMRSSHCFPGQMMSCV